MNKRIKVHVSHWGSRAGLGPFVDWQDWNIWRHCFTIGFSFGRWEIGLIITLWDVEETSQMLQSRGMTEQEARDFCDGIRRSLPDPYSSRVNLKREIEKALAQ